MSAWHDNRRRSRSRPRAASGRHQHGVEYVAAYGPNTHYSTESSSDCSSDDYGSRQGSIRIPRGSVRRNPPRAPTAPASPNTPSLIDSSSDTPSSLASSRRYEYDYGGMHPAAEPEIVDHSYPSYTGAYGIGHNPHYVPPPPPPAPQAKRRPAPVTIPPPIGKPVNCIVAEPENDLTSPIRRGGPKAGSYLDAFAPPPDPEVVTLKSPELPLTPMSSPPGPTQVGAARHVMSVYPGYYAAPPHAHPVAPIVMSDGSWEGDEYEESVYSRGRRDRPRNGIRHVAGLGIGRESRSRPPPRSRSRGPPPRDRDYERELIEREVQREEREEREGRSRRHRSRSRHHRHRSRPPREEEDVKYSAELQAKIDAVRTRLEAVRMDPYAQEIIAAENIKFDELLPKNLGRTA